jgi:alcohol dehydrogenase
MTQTQSFQTQLSTTRIVFGEGVLAHVAREAHTLGMRTVLLLMDPFLASTPAGQQCTQLLRDAGMTVVLSTDVEPDPTVTTVEAGAAYARAQHVDGIIALGGGSAMDTAKAIGLLLYNNASHLAPFFHGGGSTPTGMLPLIAIPTTAGTGAEVTFVAIVTEPHSQRKLLVRHPTLAPHVALVDPLLSATMPTSLTMATGVDALAHALESMTSTMAAPLSDALAMHAIPLIIESLPRLIQTGHNASDRAQMCLAATTAGMAFLSGRVHLGHAVGHALGGAYHVPHGTACIVLMPQIMALIAPHRPHAIAAFARAFGCTTTDFPDTLARWLHQCGVPRLRQLLAPHHPTIPALIALIHGEERLIGLAPVQPSHAQWHAMIEATW